jgi:hypothetical protein
MGDRNTDAPTFLKYISFLYYLDRSETEPVTATENISAPKENFFFSVLAFTIHWEHPRVPVDPIYSRKSFLGRSARKNH